MVYVNPAGFPTPGLPNHGYKFFITLMAMCITAGLFVIARLATRISQAQVGADDWAITAAMVSFLTQTTLWALSVRAGYGADYLLLAEWQRFLFNKWWFLGSIFWLCTLTLYKTSILFLFNRVFVQRGFRITCWSVLILTACWGVGNIFGWIFQCLPIPAMWGQAPPTAKIRCFNQNGLWISIVIWDVGSDLAILLLPQPMVWKLNLKRREKFMLTGMFLMGAIVVVFSLMSCSTIAAELPHANSDRNIYTFALANIFQVLETGVGVIGACLPIMRQPARKWFPRLMGRTTEESEFYYDDTFREQYVMQDVSGEGRHKPNLQAAWNSVSVSGPQSSGRESDELYILPAEDSAVDVEGGGGQQQIRIRKETEYSIKRG